MSFTGRQDAVFTTGRADGTVRLSDMAGRRHLYALGAAAGLDGEVTILDSEPFVSRVRGPGGAYVVRHDLDGMALFLVWTEMNSFHEEVPVPQSVGSYGELESFVRTAATERGMRVDQPVAFLLRGTPAGMTWHINVDRTEGRPIDRDLFRNSKAFYTLQGEHVEIFGVYSAHHGGVFMTPSSTLHMHFASRDSDATGHVDAIEPAGMVLLLPEGGGN